MQLGPLPGRDPVLHEVEPAGKLAELLRYWQRLKGDALPARGDLDPIDIGAALLPHVFLADVLDGGRRFRWRLIGTHILRHAGSNDTGKDLEVSLAPAMKETIIGHYRRVVDERRPLCHRGEFVGRDQRLYRYDRLLLPLASDGERVDLVLGGAEFARALSATAR
jgi:hypothetical protein